MSSSSCMRMSRPSWPSSTQFRSISSAMRVVIEGDGALELERGQPGEALVEPLPVGLERPYRLVRAGENIRDLPELVAPVADEERHRLALLGDGEDHRVGLLRHTLGRAMPRARLL